MRSERSRLGFSPRRKKRPHAGWTRAQMSRYTRRNFIKRAVAATGTLGFATGCRRLQVTDRNELSRGAIDRLRAKLKGRLILPTDPSYESARRVFYWNAGTERRPRIIVQCAREEDALRAVEFARRH